MTPKDLLNKNAVDYLFHPVVIQKKHEERGPRIITEGKGLRIKDINGREYLDAFSSLWNVLIGHGQEPVIDAMHNQGKTLEYFSPFSGFSTPPAIELAEKVIRMMPDDWQMGRVLFTCGGSETNDTNIKIARMYWSLQNKPQKNKIIARKSAYHGLTLGAMAATGIDAFKTHFNPMAPGFVHIMAPYCFRCELGFTYPGCGIACAKQLDEMIRQEGPDTVAAFIGEPVMGAGGVIVPPNEYWPMVRKICDKHNVLVIADEVITGFGRTGKMFGCMNWDFKPDLISFAKGITSGYFPLGCAVMRTGIYETIRDGLGEDTPFRHGFTYNNHPVGCAAGIANLQFIEDHKLVENAARMGKYMADSLENLRSAHGSVGEVRSKGLMAAVEFAKDKKTKAPLGARPGQAPLRVEEIMWENGIYIRPLFESICIAPSLIISKEDIDLVIKALDTAIVQVEKEFLG